MSNDNTQNFGDNIAIISLAGRFPGADSINEFWNNIKNGVESIQFFTDEELKKSNIEPALFNDSNYVKAGAVIEDIDMFDPQFFGFNKREAEILNPQHRMFLECAWEAIESAGYNPETYNGRIGVYAGEGFNTYLLNIASDPHLASTMNEIQMLIGNDKDFLATQVSYKLNLKGPGVTVQCGCSTSLVALTMACQGLNSYQCDMALAGGIRLGIPQKGGYLYKEGSILSPDGHCKPFDEKANGTVGGNGAAIVALKRLEDALADGDYIYAVIKGTAINNDGSLKIGYTAPSIEGQSEVIYEAQEVAGINPENIEYIETHGTGTELGDPIEFNALTEVYRNKTSKKRFCALGSVKANIGHLDAAAGTAGVIKAALTLKNKTIPPCVNFEKPNPKLKMEDSPFYVPTEALAWKSEGKPRRAGVSSFGIGGTNAHVVLEEAPEIQSTVSNKPWHMLTLSAKTENALDNMTINLLEFLRNNPETNLADAAHTLQMGRKEFNHRKAVVCNNIADAVEVMEKSFNERIVKGSGEVTGRGVVFMFPGQGSQYINMGLELYKNEKIFKEQVDLCAKLLEPHLGLDLREVLFPNDQEADAEQINQTYLAQPALFTMEYAMAQTLISYGIVPKAMVGHSVGEYVAACISGVITLKEVLPLIAARGRMMQGQPRGVMTAVSECEKEVLPLLNEDVSIAAVNSPMSCVISGPEEKVSEVEAVLEQKGVKYVRLHTSHAFHSSMMDSIIEPFAAKVGKAQLNAPKIPIVSNLTGTWLKDEEAKDPIYWARHLAEAVRFSQCLEELLKDDSLVLIEAGPGNTLSTLAKQQINKESNIKVVPTMRHPRQKNSDTAVLYCALGKMWSEGIKVNFSELYKNEKRMRIPLPTYPFERISCWMGGDRKTQKPVDAIKKAAKNPEVSEWLYAPYWKPAVPVEQVEENSLKWLIFADEHGIADSVASRLNSMGNETTMVYAGEKYKADENDSYSLNPEKAEDYVELFKTLKSKDKLPDNIIHLWCVDDKHKEDKSRYFEEMQNRGFYSLINIAKAISKLNIIEQVKISVVTDCMQEVCGEKELHPEKATVLGAVRVIPQEYMNVSCISIDINIADKLSQCEYMAENIIRETQKGGSEYAIAYRGSSRWVQSFESIKPSGNNITTYLKNEGVYLVTGGLGNIGLIFAGHLAKEYKAKLVLISRTEFPEKDQWTQWLAAKGSEDSVSKKIVKLMELEEAGAEVLIYVADVSSEEQMQKAVETAVARFGIINGVIHAAGVVGEKTYSSIQELDIAKYKEQAVPKIYGTNVLAKVLRDIKLDFYLMVSSLSVVLGGLGLSAYSAVNLYMDAFARKCNTQSEVPWISANWDGWAFTEKVESPDGFFISPEEGVKALGYVLAKGMMKNTIVSSGDLKHRIDRWVISSNAGIKNNAQSKQGRKDCTGGQGNELEQKIAYIWSDLLGVEQLGLNDDFFELGGNSLIAAQVIYRMRAELQLDMPIKEFFDTPTVSGIAKKIQSMEDNKKKIAEALNSVKSLSKTEVEKLLEQVKARKE